MKPTPFVYHMIPREGFGKAPFYRQDGGPVDGHTSIRYSVATPTVSVGIRVIR
jgi:hypothetical protein